MNKLVITLAISVLINGVAFASEIPRLEHAFVIVMENHAYDQIIGNPDAPFINAYASEANLATNYYGVGHPSLTNYLEIVGGSNFGVISAWTKKPFFKKYQYQNDVINIWLLSGRLKNELSPEVSPVN